MRLGQLWVYHSAEFPAAGFESKGVKIETCLRKIFVTLTPPTSGTHWTQGQDAYRFLLRLACGLESRILGETDIFGQIREAWGQQSTDHPELTRVFHWLYEDTKEIRSQHIQGIGGQSYGTLARRTLALSPSEKILVLGAGLLARSILPYLDQQNVTVWNRSSTRLDRLRENRLNSTPSVDFICGQESEPLLWSKADAVMICIPPDLERDTDRIRWLRDSTLRPRVLHLGGHRKDLCHWSDTDGLLTLDDLFEQESTQSSVREVQLTSAARACRERAHLRSLGDSIHIAHGWEDLVAFQTV